MQIISISLIYFNYGVSIQINTFNILRLYTIIIINFIMLVPEGGTSRSLSFPIEIYISLIGNYAALAKTHTAILCWDHCDIF